MDAFFERLIVRAATIDELLSDDFEPLPGRDHDTQAAARRLDAWHQAAASGDQSLFERRLSRDRLTNGHVLERLDGVRRKSSAAVPAWAADAIWIEQALQGAGGKPDSVADQAEPCPFEHLFAPLVEQADARLWSGIDGKATSKFNHAARANLRHALLKELTGLCAPALYERLAALRKTAGPATAESTGTALYEQFVAGMKTGGFRSLFEDKPVLLRLIAIVTQQWIDSSREFVLRLDADLAAIHRDILHSASGGQVAKVEGDFSDPHNDGRSVRIITFADGARVVYKPKDLRLDVAWHALVERLNAAGPPVDLKSVRAIACDGYGWTEFIAHSGTDPDGCKLFFRRAGALLALLHSFVAADMHQENIIAAGDCPVPIDLETIFHAAASPDGAEPAAQAADAARETLANSIMSVGLLPAYGRSAFNDVFAMGGMTSGWTAKNVLTWTNINTDAMRPARSKQGGETNPNLPHVNGAYARFADHIEEFISGFEAYANFLSRRTRDASLGGLFDGFSGIPVRKVIRPTKFYHMLIQRLKAHQSMGDGAIWSAQADFIARLADWEKDADPLWPLQRAERSALITLNVPHFVAASDASEMSDAADTSVRTQAPSGLHRARERVRGLDAKEIAWQIEVIRENTNSTQQPAAAPVAKTPEAAPSRDTFAAEAGKIADELARYAVRRGPSAAWIGLDFLGDAEAFQLICLGPDLYNGEAGIALFLAAHAAATGAKTSAELALAGIANLRKSLKSRNAPRIARSLGVGGGTGLGSIVYALTVMSKLLRDGGLLNDAQAVAALISDDIIAADKQLDVIGGSAGAILSLLRLHRDSRSENALRIAVKCGEHLMAQSRVGPDGRRSWVGQGFGARPLNGMSHGAAGFAYALASLAKASGREDFALAASECIAFEDESYDAGRHNWPDLRGGEPSWPCQWCHGAAGIGLARAATVKRGAMDAARLAPDIRHAVEGVTKSFPGALDTLCCGTLGNIEFLCEAGDALNRADLRELAAQRLAAVLQNAASAGDYRWNSGKRQFNLGLFRGLAGVGYTALRQVDASLPNVIIWE